MTNEQLLRNEEEAMSRNNFRKFLGIQIEKIEPEYALLSLPVTETLLQAGGILHGGVYAVLLDSVIGSAIRTTLDVETQFTVTSDLNISFVRGTNDGTIYAEGRVVNRGSMLIVGTGEIRDGEGKLLATGRGTFVIRNRKPPAGQ